VNGVTIFAPVQRASTGTNTQYSASQFQWSGAFSGYLTTGCSAYPLITPNSASSSQVRPAQIVRQGATSLRILPETPTRRRPYSSHFALAAHAS
jgi:hypothetical protein